MKSGADSAERRNAGLSALHQRLEAHFFALRTRRDEQGDGLPLFALEHGLSAAELMLLKAEVGSAIARGQLPKDFWLPIVVYAAEVGYQYCGDEYWPIFAASTPGWAEYEDRHYIRRRFQDFRATFGGAEPTGSWARTFRIICWPITHAVLPTLLQRQLAQLLFDSRRELSTELLAHPDELGRRLAARSWHASSRFKNFAQNTALLGQVAAALLGDEEDEEEESPYLLSSTLERIVEDLSVEQEARLWLRDAKASAKRVRKRGFRRGQDPAKPEAAPRTRLPSATDPTLLLQHEADGWTPYLELPDMSILAERLTLVHEELGRLRAHVRGVTGPPMARGRLLFPGQRVPLTDWPDPRSPLIQLENGSSAVNRLLSDQCVFPRGPLWVFRIREPWLAREVRGTFVRPAHQYIVLSEGALPVAPWITPAPITASGITAYHVDVPVVIEGEILKALQAIGLGVVTDVEVRPAGVVPASWDGEGTGVWLSGEDPVMAIRSNRAVSKCVFTVDSVPSVLSWPDGTEEIFTRTTELAPGAHEIHMVLLQQDVDEPVAEGHLTILIRSPHTRPPSGTFREGLMILANPADPTLTELWDGRASLDVLGPVGAHATFDVSLTDRSGTRLVSRRFGLKLPVDSTTWRSAFAGQFRRPREVQRSYDDAESCLVAVSHPSLGTVTLQCDREFSALRWAVSRDGDGPFLRLIDNTEERLIATQRFEFAHPAEAIRVGGDPGSLLREPEGGLFVASTEDVSVAVILPPDVRDFADLRRISVSPELEEPTRSVGETLRFINLAQLWAGASLPADPFAAAPRLSVIRVMTSLLVGVIAGRRWARLDLQAARDQESASIGRLQELVGEEGYQRALASDLDRRINDWKALPPEKRIEDFAAALAVHARIAGVRDHDARLGEFLLRLASDPASLVAWPPEEVRSRLEFVLTSPVLARAARFVVLAIEGEAEEPEEAGSAYRGWAWA